MKELLIVGIGGGIGSVLRYKTGALITWLHSAGVISSNALKFPWATFAVNIVGCFLIGLFAVSIERMTDHNAEARLLLITGLLGGFTTFSAFSLETLALLRTGSPLLAAVNAAASVALGLTAVWLGMKVGH